MVAHVLVEIKAKSINKTFDYLVPTNLSNVIQTGMRVLVPFGKKNLEGFVLSLSNDNNSEFKLKNISEIVDDHAVLNDELLKLGEYISKKTLCNLISAYQTMLPTALKAKNNFNVNKKFVSYVSLNVDIDTAIKMCKNDKQREIINIIGDNTLKSDCYSISDSACKTLIKNGVLLEELRETYRLTSDYLKENNKVILTEEQDNAVNTISSSLNCFKPFLLHGVTGSGKTEVYMSLIEKVIENGKEAIVLVPEISLTPQLTSKFRKRFGDKIAILHSRLNNGEKYDEWRKIERKEVSIVIGARSAIFAPLTNLGIIIIDEEHSLTYKQENTPKYNAIDVAIFRAKYHNIPVVLGSATPQIESYTRAKQGIYELIELKNRVNTTLPKVNLIDMKDEIKNGFSILSSELIKKMNDRIGNGEQIILLLNRRGYSTITMCKNCGFVYKCPYCDIPLIYHKASNTMRCHYCGHGDRRIYKCPECGSESINDMGLGTEKLEEFVCKNIINSKVLRMDVDTTSTKGSIDRIIKSFENEEYNVLIGTQMIAKGLDFKKVTLVGVINGDSSLNIPDFRSAERTFQLLNQVAGRAGRDIIAGEVIIQAYNINHYSIIYASKHDYLGFYNEEMKIRKVLKYSPFYNLSLVKLKGNDLNILMEEGNKIVDHLRSLKLNDVIILGPSASTIPKINNVYFIQIMIKYKNSNLLIDSFKFINERYTNNSKVSVDIDLNPIKI